MLCVLSNDGQNSRHVSIDDVSYYEENHIKLYNVSDEYEPILWFDGDKWLFPKPTPTIAISSQTKLLEKISNQLDTLINLTVQE